MSDRVGGRREDRRSNVQLLTAVLATLVVVAILYEIARRLGVPYPTLLVLGGLVLAFIPGLPTIKLEPDLVLLVFLPPLLFTMVIVALIAHAAVPTLTWAGAFTLGAIVGPTDALAATTVFRRLGTP